MAMLSIAFRMKERGALLSCSLLHYLDLHLHLLSSARNRQGRNRRRIAGTIGASLHMESREP